MLNMKLFRRSDKNQTLKQKIGQKGEDLACLYLKTKGYQIIDRNYRKKWGEIDIVTKKSNNLYFFEVKTMTVIQESVIREIDVYLPEDNIHRNKLKRLFRTIESYLLEKKINDEMDWQLDVISVYLDKEGRELKLEHLRDVF